MNSQKSQLIAGGFIGLIIGVLATMVVGGFYLANPLILQQYQQFISSLVAFTAALLALMGVLWKENYSAGVIRREREAKFQKEEEIRSLSELKNEMEKTFGVMHKYLFRISRIMTSIEHRHVALDVLIWSINNSGNFEVDAKDMGPRGIISISIDEIDIPILAKAKIQIVSRVSELNDLNFKFEESWKYFDDYISTIKSQITNGSIDKNFAKETVLKRFKQMKNECETMLMLVAMISEYMLKTAKAIEPRLISAQKEVV